VDDIDSVIVCTGYSFGFSVLERGELIKVDDNRVRLYLNMYAPYIPHAHTLAIIGLVQPLGSIMPIAEMQASARAHV
jgi:dimethylaniline monooxygenase (N-oxide forming)